MRRIMDGTSAAPFALRLLFGFSVVAASAFGRLRNFADNHPNCTYLTSAMKSRLVLVVVFLAAPLLAHAQDAGVAAVCDQFASTPLTGVSADMLALPNGSYRIYYMGNGMQSASSSDGLAWKVDAGVRLSSNPGDPVPFVSNPWVFATSDGRYRMIYEGDDAAGNRRLYSAISSDTLTFVREGLVMAGESVDQTRSGQTFLSVPTGLRLPDARLRMYYVSDGADIRSAASADEGLSWTPDGGTALSQAVDPVVYADAGGYTMIYTDWANPNRTKRLLTARSSDGVNFTPTGTVLATVTNGTYNIVDAEIASVGGLRRLWFSVMTGASPGATPIYTCVLSQPFSVSASGSGPLTSLDLVATVTPSSLDVGKQGNFYLAALVGNAIYLNDGGLWRAYTGGPITAYARGTLAARTIPVGTNLDVSALSGTVILVGYGIDEADLLSGKYATVYTIGQQ